MKLDTEAQANKSTNSEIWLKVNLDQVYCVDQVIEYDKNTEKSYQFKWSCTKFDCNASCVTTMGVNACGKWLLSVNMSDDAPLSTDDFMDNNCKLGNTVTLEKLKYKTNPLTVAEIAIYGTKGETKLQLPKF